MKKLLVLSLMAFTFLGASAQNKIGYINTEDLINSMPEADKANSALQDYQTSLTQQGNDYLTELNEKDSIFVRDSAKLSPAARELRRNDLVALYQKVQNWNQTMQQMINEKQQALLVPIRQKAIQAIKDVSKENGFTYILDQQALLVSPPSEDILPLVKKKLGIKDAPRPAAPSMNGGPMQ
ncbi:MAG TPA: OmpH family outer membrane protein [Ferruginibacter sp.]|jgi:outer membrane protein|nr:OmpH family outer membrane protein [Ferruginibacter sp.]